MTDATSKTAERTMLALLARPLSAVRLTVGRWITGEVVVDERRSLMSQTTGPNPENASTGQSPRPAAVETVLNVLADGFGVHRGRLAALVDSDPEIRAKVHALAAGQGTSRTVEDVHALIKQRLLYER